VDKAHKYDVAQCETQWQLVKLRTLNCLGTTFQRLDTVSKAVRRCRAATGNTKAKTRHFTVDGPLPPCASVFASLSKASRRANEFHNVSLQESSPERRLDVLDP
jgi:hypothetical protein